MIEAALIDSIHGLTNAVADHGISNGRSTLNDILQRYGATPLGTEPPVPALKTRLTPKTINLYDEVDPGYCRTGAGWFPGARHAFNGRQILEGPEFEFNVGDHGRRVPLSKSAQNPLLYWPRN